MTFLLNRFFAFLLLIGIVMPIGQTQAIWEQPPHSFAPATGDDISMHSDANGNAIVVLENNGTQEAYYYSRITNMWSGSTILGLGNQFNALDMHASGTAVAVWVDPNNTDLHSAYFNGLNWTPGSPDPLATSASFSNLQVIMNGPNSAIVTWFDGINTVNSAFFSAGTWGATIPVVTGVGINDPIDSDYSTNGTAVLSYTNAGALEVRNFVGGTWQTFPGFVLDPALPPASHNAQVSIDALGRAVVIWVNTAGDVKASSFNGTLWSAPVTISNTAGNNPFSTSFDMSPSGTGVAAWVDGAGVGYSNSYNGTTWGTPQIFSSPVSNQQTAVSVNASGNALLLFQTPDLMTPFGGDIYGTQLPLNGVWTTPEFVYTPLLSIFNLIPSLSDNGDAFAAWSDGLEGSIYFATIEPALFPPLVPPLPPASIVGSFCKNKFAMQTDCVHIITWAPSPTPTVVAYEILRNGSFIGIVSASEFVFVDHDRCKETDVYTVLAIDINGLISTPVVVVIP